MKQNVSPDNYGTPSRNTCSTAETVESTLDMIIPITIPKGEASEKIPTKIRNNHLLIFALAKVNPKQKAMINLWAQTAVKRTKNEGIFVCKPMAIPSKIEWKERANCNIKDLIKQWCPKSTWECSWLMLLKKDLYFYNLFST